MVCRKFDSSDSVCRKPPPISPVSGTIIVVVHVALCSRHTLPPHPVRSNHAIPPTMPTALSLVTTRTQNTPDLPKETSSVRCHSLYFPAAAIPGPVPFRALAFLGNQGSWFQPQFSCYLHTQPHQAACFPRFSLRSPIDLFLGLMHGDAAFDSSMQRSSSSKQLVRPMG